MSETASGDSHLNESASAISEAEDVKMFQAARRIGRRNALGDLSEQLSQVVDTGMSSSDVDKMGPHFQSMSIKN